MSKQTDAALKRVLSVVDKLKDCPRCRENKIVAKVATSRNGARSQCCWCGWSGAKPLDPKTEVDE